MVDTESKSRGKSERLADPLGKFYPFTLFIFVIKLHVEVFEMMDFHKFPERRWFELGLYLGLRYSTLKTIEADFKGDTRRCFLECLTASVKEVIHLTWQSLTQALIGIGEREVANNILKIGNWVFQS